MKMTNSCEWRSSVLKQTIRDHVRRICHCGPNYHRYSYEKPIVITNDYTAAQVVVLGSAGEVVRGSVKGIFFDDGPGEPRRVIEIDVE